MSKKIGVIIVVILIAVFAVLIFCDWGNSAVFELQEGEAEALGVVFPEGGDYEAHLGLFNGYKNEGEYDKAIVVAKKMIELSSKTEGGYLDLESVYKKAGKYEEALVVIDKLIKIAPKEERISEVEIGYILERIDLLEKLGRQNEADKARKDLAERYSESKE